METPALPDSREAGQRLTTTPFNMAGWRVDPASNRLSRGSETVRLEPRAMSVLVYLAGRPGKVVTREELEGAVWAGMVVGYDALSNAIIKLRRAFGDKARDPRVIETISKTGYRLIADVSTASVPGGADRQPHLPRRPAAIELPDRPSIAVLAFNNMSGDPGQEYFGDGVAEDIITDLSKISGLFVIARNSAFAYKGKQVDLRRVSRELGVRHVLEGSVRRAGNRLRISAQLIDGRTGGHVWAERFDREMTDIFAVQDEVVRVIVSTLTPTLIEPERHGAVRQRTANREAYDYFLRGREQDHRDTRQANARARTLLEKAIELDPEFSLAYSHLSRNYAVCWVNRWDEFRDDLAQTATELARKAIDFDGSNPHGHFALAAVTVWMRQHELALREAKIAIEIEPNFADGHAVLGMTLMYMGEPGQAIASLETAMRLDPHYRDAYLHIIGQAYFHSGRLEEAANALKRRLVRKPDSDTSRVLLAATYGHLGRMEDARAEWREALRVNPQYSLDHKREALPYKRAKDFDLFKEGLRRAGLP